MLLDDDLLNRNTVEKVAGTLRVSAADPQKASVFSWSRHMECAYYITSLSGIVFNSQPEAYSRGTASMFNSSNDSARGTRARTPAAN